MLVFVREAQKHSTQLTIHLAKLLQCKATLCQTLPVIAKYCMYLHLS